MLKKSEKSTGYVLTALLLSYRNVSASLGNHDSENKRREMMLKKIERVLMRVKDVTEAADFYAGVFGLKQLWRDEREDSTGLLFPDSDTELVLTYDPARSGQAEIQYLVDDVVSAVQRSTEQGCVIIVQPFDSQMGKCAVLEDPFGLRLFILDRSKAAVELNLI